MKNKVNRRISLALILICLVVLASPAYAITPSGTAKTARVTGATPSGEALPNPNHTDSNYQVCGTDLGILWDNGRGQIMAAFGDTYGTGWTGPGAGGPDWRSNVLGLSADTNLSDGMSFSTMITNTPGHAKELIPSAHDTSGNGDFTNIPTAGVSVGSRDYIHFMNIKSWGPGEGEWHTNYSELAYSDDSGQNWAKSGVRWGADSIFGQAAFAKSGGYVYMMGTPPGRRGNIYLARVAEASVLSKSSYQYWDGSSWITNNESAAKPIVIGPAGELSFQYNSYFGQWLMSYLDINSGAIVLRHCGSLTGSWSGEKIVLTGTQYPGMYGGFLHPWSSGKDLYYTISQWDPYNVFLMHSTLNEDALGDNMLSDPGFENQSSGGYQHPWYLEGAGGVDRGMGYARTGANNAFLRSSSGWNAIRQKVAVKPNTNYTFTGYIKTSGNCTNGILGVRAQDGSLIQSVPFGVKSSYTQISITVNTGPNSIIEVYGGMWASGDTWVQFDDMCLLPGGMQTEFVFDGGFEGQKDSSISAPWMLEGAGGIDHDAFQRSGHCNAWLRSSSGWNAVKQTIGVAANTNYRLTGYVKTSSNNNEGYLGIRFPDGTANAERSYGSCTGYSLLTVDFNSGNNTSVTVFCGMWSRSGDTWVQIDDISVQKR